ncbi:DNA-binding response regulator [Falsiroseomonas bella]|uniref:DNA-binding response regulator n=1 Tax=Falsiroseomonas bella TaxID=2184016 RepID=A0A317FC10_9PROT|nr:LuxR C-terminal-related transcriptional regulator [Falsiroseomonas bella]PWS35469.1 DNA-binding response regulator [Falsiroseomonas bella]
MSAEARITHVVDDESAARRSLSLLLEAAGFGVETFPSAEAFLRAAHDGLPFGCVLLNPRMAGLDGPALQHAMAEQRLVHPVIVITAHGDVGMAVRAMKAGACDVIEKPFCAEDVLRAVAEALRLADAALEEARRVAEAEARVATLSARETEVLQGLVAGQQNKMIAQDLGISPRTVEIHRGNLMAKLGARSLPEAVRIALAAGVIPMAAAAKEAAPRRVVMRSLPARQGARQ